MRFIYSYLPTSVGSVLAENLHAFSVDGKHPCGCRHCRHVSACFVKLTGCFLDFVSARMLKAAGSTISSKMMFAGNAQSENWPERLFAGGVSPLDKERSDGGREGGPSRFV